MDRASRWRFDSRFCSASRWESWSGRTHWTRRRWTWSCAGATVIAGVAVATMALHIQAIHLVEPAVAAAMSRVWLGASFLAILGTALRMWLPVLPAFGVAFLTQVALPVWLDESAWTHSAVAWAVRPLVGQAGFIVPSGLFNRVMLEPWLESVAVLTYASACMLACAGAVRWRLERRRRSGR